MANSAPPPPSTHRRAQTPRGHSSSSSSFFSSQTVLTADLLDVGADSDRQRLAGLHVHIQIVGGPLRTAANRTGRLRLSHAVARTGRVAPAGRRRGGGSVLAGGSRGCAGAGAGHRSVSGRLAVRVQGGAGGTAIRRRTVLANVDLSRRAHCHGVERRWRVVGDGWYQSRVDGHRRRVGRRNSSGIVRRPVQRHHRSAGRASSRRRSQCENVARGGGRRRRSRLNVQRRPLPLRTTSRLHAVDRPGGTAGGTGAGRRPLAAAGGAFFRRYGDD